MNKNIYRLLFGAFIFLLAACNGTNKRTSERTPEELKKLTIREITITVENWGHHRNPSLFDEYAYQVYTQSLIEDTQKAIEEAEDEMFMDFDPWSMGQDPDPKTRCEVTDVYDMTDSTATVDVTMTQWKAPMLKKLFLIYTEDGWRIDDMSINEEQTTLRSFIKR